jgi:hypothetical protein
MSPVSNLVGHGPHCGNEHHPAEIVRLDNDHLQCKKCKQPFPSVLRVGRVIGCLEIPEKHDCGGQLRKESLAIAGTMGISDGVLQQVSCPNEV